MKKNATFFFLSSFCLRVTFLIFFALNLTGTLRVFASKQISAAHKTYLSFSTNKRAAIWAKGVWLSYKHLSSPETFNLLEGPSFSQNYEYTILESVVVGVILDTITANVPNGGALTYAIQTGNTNKAFMIDTVSGILKIAKLLNFHTQARYSLTIKATDAAGLFAEAMVNITIEPAAVMPATSTLTWETAANQPYVVSEAQGKAVNNKLYVFGGFDSQKPGFTPTSRANVYDPALNKWTPLASMPPINGTAYGGVTHAGITTDGTDIYMAGGYTANASGTGQKFGTKEVWKYLVAENRYERLPDLPVVIAAGQLEYVNGHLHHIGGTNQARNQDLGNHYVLHLDSLEAGWKTRAPLPNPRQHAGSAVYESKIYYIGGQTGHDKNLKTQKEVHLYDPSTNTWVKKADLPVAAGTSGRGHISSAVVVAGNRILVIAGETVHSNGQSNLVSAYTPGINTWENLTPLPQARFSGVAALLNNAIFYTGGSRTNTTFKSSAILLPAQTLISNLTAKTNGAYTIGELVKGSAVYTDQNYQITELPSYLNKALYIKTPNNDKSQAGEEVFSFDLTKNATLYVAYDPRATVLPAWLNDWQKLPELLTINDPNVKTLRLYSKTLPVGKVSMAGNLATPALGALSNYIVIIVPAITTGITSEQENKMAELKLYPNPSEAGHEVTVALFGLSPGQSTIITLRDIAGRLIHTQSAIANQAGVVRLEAVFTQLSAGLYIVNAYEPSGKIAQDKLIIK